MWTCHFTHATTAPEVVLAKGVNKGAPLPLPLPQLRLRLQQWLLAVCATPSAE